MSQSQESVNTVKKATDYVKSREGMFVAQIIIVVTA